MVLYICYNRSESRQSGAGCTGAGWLVGKAHLHGDLRPYLRTAAATAPRGIAAASAPAGTAYAATPSGRQWEWAAASGPKKRGDMCVKDVDALRGYGFMEPCKK